MGLFFRLVVKENRTRNTIGRVRRVDILQTTIFEVHTRRHLYDEKHTMEVQCTSHHLLLFQVRTVMVPPDGAHTAKEKDNDRKICEYYIISTVL